MSAAVLVSALSPVNIGVTEFCIKFYSEWAGIPFFMDEAQIGRNTFLYNFCCCYGDNLNQAGSTRPPVLYDQCFRDHSDVIN